MVHSKPMAQNQPSGAGSMKVAMGLEIPGADGRGETVGAIRKGLRAAVNVVGLIEKLISARLAC